MNRRTTKRENSGGGEENLVHAMVEWASVSEPSLLLLGEDLPRAASASKLKLDELRKEVRLRYSSWVRRGGGGITPAPTPLTVPTYTTTFFSHFFFETRIFFVAVLSRFLFAARTRTFLRFLFRRCVCVCVFIKLRMTAQSVPVILVILCHSRWYCVCVCVFVCLCL